MYELLKFVPSPPDGDPLEYVNQFLSGSFYMNSIGYFWKAGFEGQNDLWEGTARSEKAHDSPLPNDLKSYIKNNVTYRLEDCKYINVLSFVRHGYDPISKYVDAVDPRFANFGNYVVRIKDLESFVNRVVDAMKKIDNSYGLAGPVVYHHRNEEIQYQDCFNKWDWFAWQNEWRIAFLPDYPRIRELAYTNPTDLYETPFVLQVGDVSNLVDVFPTSEYIHGLSKIYNGYSIVEQIDTKEEEIRKIGALGLPAPYEAFCDQYVGYNRERFDQLVNGIGLGERMMFSI